MRTLLVGLSLLALSATAEARCTGDCGGGGSTVSIDELVLGVNIALGQGAPEQCPAYPACEIGPVCISDLIRAVGNALEGCPAPVLPAVVASDPPAGASDVARTAWLRVEFAAPVDAADFSDLVWVECHGDQSDRRVRTRITVFTPRADVISSVPPSALARRFILRKPCPSPSTD